MWGVYKEPHNTIQDAGHSGTPQYRMQGTLGDNTRDSEVHLQEPRGKCGE